MDDRESDETDPEVIFAAPNHIDYEEVESQASNEPELTIVDTESLVGDSLEVVEIEDTSTIEETRRGFTYVLARRPITLVLMMINSCSYVY